MLALPGKTQQGLTTHSAHWTGAAPPSVPERRDAGLPGLRRLGDAHPGSDAPTQNDLVLRVLARLQGYDRLTWLTYDRAEYLANVALFIPVGLFLLLLFGTRFWWLAVAAALVMTSLIETAQRHDPRPRVRRAGHRRQHLGGGGRCRGWARAHPARHAAALARRRGQAASGSLHREQAQVGQHSAGSVRQLEPEPARPRSPRRRCRSGRRERRRSCGRWPARCRCPRSSRRHGRAARRPGAVRRAVRRGRCR